jgi:hypothetical protein
MAMEINTILLERCDPGVSVHVENHVYQFVDFGFFSLHNMMYKINMCAWAL